MWEVGNYISFFKISRCIITKNLKIFLFINHAYFFHNCLFLFILHFSKNI